MTKEGGKENKKYGKEGTKKQGVHEPKRAPFKSGKSLKSAGK